MQGRGKSSMPAFVSCFSVYGYRTDSRKDSRKDSRILSGFPLSLWDMEAGGFSGDCLSGASVLSGLQV